MFRYEAGSAKNFPRGGSRSKHSFTHTDRQTEGVRASFGALPHKIHGRSVSDRPARGGSRSKHSFTHTDRQTEGVRASFGALPHKIHGRSVSDRPACAVCVARVISEPR